MIHRIGAGLLLALFLPLGAGAATMPFPRAEIDKIVAHQLSTNHLAGISLAIERDGKIVYAHGFGFGEIAHRTPVDPAMYFEIGSITKQFTATAIAALVADGKLELSDAVSAYLPDAPHAAEITIQQLLNQTTGLTDYLAVPAARALTHSSTVTPAELYALVAKAPLTFTPGSKFEYCNTNYIVLGALIERASGMPYGAYLESRVLHGTPFAGISVGPPAGKAVAAGYGPAHAAWIEAPWSTAFTYAAGGLYATPSDLARWDDAFFNGHVLAPEVVSALTTAPILRSGSPTTYAAGWIDSAIDGHPEIWHNGAIPGFVAENAYFPEDHLAIVAAVNTTGYDTLPLIRTLFRAIVPPSAAQIAVANTPAPGERSEITAQVREQWRAWASMAIDRTLYAPAAAAYFTDAVVTQVGRALAAVGAPTAFVYRGSITRDGSTAYRYTVQTPAGAQSMLLSFDALGKIDGIFFKPE